DSQELTVTNQELKAQKARVVFCVARQVVRVQQRYYGSPRAGIAFQNIDGLLKGGLLAKQPLPPRPVYCPRIVGELRSERVIEFDHLQIVTCRQKPEPLPNRICNRHPPLAIP